MIERMPSEVKGQLKRKVGDLKGPNARMWWSPTDLSKKTDGEISKEKILADIESGVIPSDGIARIAGRKILILRSAVLKYLDMEGENKST